VLSLSNYNRINKMAKKYNNKEEKKSNFLGRVRTAGLATLAGAMSLYSTGCATPQAIQARRYLAEQGELHNVPFSQFEASPEGELAVRGGIDITFGEFYEIPREAASGLAAFGYGIVKPGFREFYDLDSKYNGLTIFYDGNRYIDGNKSEAFGEWTRWGAIGVGLAGMGNKGGSGSDKRPGEEDVYIPLGGHLSGVGGGGNPGPNPNPEPEPEPEPNPDPSEWDLGGGDYSSGN